MRKLRRVIWFALGGLVLLAVGVVGAWFYVMSNVETPDYQVLERDGAIELRAYPELIVAEAQTSGEQREAIGQGFRALAAYIFAKNRDGAEISMTAPVTQSADEGAIGGEGASWRIHFVMPSGYQLADLPPPGDPSVHLKTLPAGERAAIRFSGRADSTLLAEQEALLRQWLEARGLAYAATPTYAFYNDPFTPGFLRRNEVIFDLESR